MRRPVAGFLAMTLFLSSGPAYALRGINPAETAQAASLSLMLNAGAEEKPVATLTGPTQEISALAFHPEGRMMVAGSKDIRLFSWEPSADRAVSAVEKTGRIIRFAFTPDGGSLITGLPGGGLARYRLPSETLLWKSASKGEQIHQGDILSLTMAEDPAQGPLLLSVGKEGTVRQWKVADGTHLKVWEFAEPAVVQADFHLDRFWLVTLNDQKAVKVWKLGKERFELWKSFEKLGKYSHVRVLPENDELLLVLPDGRLEIRQITTTNLRRRLETKDPLLSHRRTVRSLALSSDGRMAATGDESGRIVLWDLEKGPLAVRDAHMVPVTALAFRADGRQLLSGDQKGNVYLWDLAPPAAEPSAPIPEASMQPPPLPTPPAPAPAPQKVDLDEFLLQQLENGRNPWIQTMAEGVSPEAEGWLRRVLSENPTHPEAQEADRLIQQIRVFGGDVVVLPLSVLRQGAQVDATTFYLAVETLHQADLKLIGQVIQHRDPAALLQWAAQHLTQEVSP